MNEQREFKTVFHGFRKEDVLSYIDDLLRSQKEEREAWEAERENLTAQLQEWEAHKLDLDAVEELTARCEHSEEQVTSLTATLEETQKREQEAVARCEQIRLAQETATDEAARAQAKADDLDQQLQQTQKALSALWEEHRLLQEYAEKSDGKTAEWRVQLEALLQQMGATPQPESAVPEQPEQPEQPAPSVPGDEPAAAEKPVSAETEPGKMDHWLF